MKLFISSLQGNEKYYPHINVNSISGLNAVNHLTLPTYDGGGQNVHPAIEYIEQGWNGYKYWMAMTPYPYGNNRLENPSILCSNDGINWIVPSGLTNPIFPAPTSPLFNSDPDLLLGYDNAMYCLFRGADENDVRGYYCMKSFDGIDWGTANMVFAPYGDGELYAGRSPAMIKENGGYTMWHCKNKDEKIERLFSTNPMNTWVLDQTCIINNQHGENWHLDVSKYGGQYQGIFNQDGNPGPGTLYFVTSTDGINWEMANNELIPNLSGAWDNSLYRASGIYFLNPTPHYKMWYSAFNSGTQWYTGLTELNITT